MFKRVPALRPFQNNVNKVSEELDGKSNPVWRQQAALKCLRCDLSFDYARLISFFKASSSVEMSFLLTYTFTLVAVTLAEGAWKGVRRAIANNNKNI